MIKVNTIVVRREPQGDQFDRLRVAGFFECGEYGTELVLEPAEAFGSPFTASEASVHRAYRIEQDGTDATPWETDPAEVV